MIPHSLRNQLSFLNSRFDEDVKKNALSPSSERESQSHVQYAGEKSIYDQFWQDLKEVDLVDSDRLVLHEIVKKYPLNSFDQDDLKCWFDFVCKPIHTRQGITYSILEFYTFLISVGPKVGVEIISVNFSGLGVPHLFGKYYLRTLKDCYRKRCAERQMTSKNEFISKKITQDFQSECSACDLETCIEGDIAIANDLAGKFFEWKWKKLSDSTGLEYDLITEIMDVISFAEFPDFPEVNVNHKDVYRDDYFNDSKFTKDSFGPNLRHTFYRKKNDVPQFLHQSLKVPCFEQIRKVINIIENTKIPLDAIVDMNIIPKITPEHDFCGGLQSIFDYAGKIMRFNPNVKLELSASNVNNQTWIEYIISKTMGYDVLLPDLFSKIDLMKCIPSLKFECQRHYANDQISLVAMGMNALLSLIRDPDNASKCESLWEEINQLSRKTVEDSEELSNKSVEVKAPVFLSRKATENTSLFMALKEILDNKSLSFNICTAVLQVYGCLLLQTAQESDDGAIKVQLNHHKEHWQELKISEKADKQVCSVSIPLNLNCALKSLLMLTDEQLDKLGDLTNCLSPKKIYDFNRVRHNDTFVNQALVCLAHSHKTLKRLGYDLLILTAHANPELWALKCLIKYLHLVIDDPIAMANLGAILDGFPNTLEVQILVNSLKLLIQFNDESHEKRSLEYCSTLVSLDQIQTAITLYSQLQLSLTEKIEFIRSIITKEPLEAAKLFADLQKDSNLDDHSEMTLYLRIHRSIINNRLAPSYASQLIKLSECTTELFRKRRQKFILQQSYEPITMIIDSLVLLNLLPDALNLLAAWSPQQILIDSAKDAEAWTKVCEAAVKHPKTDLKELQESLNKRFSGKFTDQKLELRIIALKSEIQRQIYKRNVEALFALKQQKQECEAGVVTEVNNQIVKCINDIFQYLDCSKDLGSVLDFLGRMDRTKKPPQKFVDLAFNAMLELAKEPNRSNVDLLTGAYDTLNFYLIEIHDTFNQSKIRKASLEVAKGLLVCNLPLKASNWMKFIFKLASQVLTGSIEPGTEMFEAQDSYFSLFSINLPPKPVKALKIIFKLGIPELDVFKEIIDLLPSTSSNDVKLSVEDRQMIISQASEFLRHSHPIVKQIGFELKLRCASSQVNGKVGSDLSLINEFIEYFPMILAGTGPIVKSRLLEAMRSLLKLSDYAMFADQYINHLTSAILDCKSLYQANCRALALAAHEPLLKIGKKLIGKDCIKKLAPGLSEKNKLEITLAYVQGLLPKNVSLALEYIKGIENDLNTLIDIQERESLFTSLINALTEKDLLDNAKLQLISCTKQGIIKNTQESTSRLWLNLVHKMIHHSEANFNKSAALWLSQIDLGALSKKHDPETQIVLLTALIIGLFNLKNDHSNDQALKLLAHLSGFDLNNSQKTDLLLLVEDNVSTNFSKNCLSASHKELKKIAWLHLTETSNINLQKTYLQASIDRENYNLAIDILSQLKKLLDAEFFETQFKILINKLTQLNGNQLDDQAKISCCIRLFKEVDAVTNKAEKLSYALQCLSAVSHLSYVYNDDKFFFLKTVLNLFEILDSTDDAIVDIVDNLLNVTNFIEAQQQSVPSEVKTLVISCHPKIAQKLQSMPNLEKFTDYLLSIYSHSIAMKIAPTVSEQIRWIVSQYLTNAQRDPLKLLDMNKLLMAHLQLSVSPIEHSITTRLATDLVSHKHVIQAMKWINYSINGASFKSLSEDESGPLLFAWSKSLHELNEFDHCLTVLKGLKTFEKPPLYSADLFLELSLTLQENDVNSSVKLLLEHWEFILKHCSSKDTADIHIELLIQKLFNCKQEIDVLSLFSSLMPLYKFKGTDDKLIRLRTLCNYIEVNPKCLDLTNCAKTYEVIKSTFYKVSKPDDFMDFLEELTMVVPLIFSIKRELVFLGITQLNLFLTKVFKFNTILAPEAWMVLCQQALNKWDVVLSDSRMTEKECKELSILLTFYMKIIALDFMKDVPALHKQLILFILKHPVYQDNEAAIASYEYIEAIIRQIGHDTKWMEKFSPLLINSLYDFHLRPTTNCMLINWFRVFSKAIEESNPEFLKTFYVESFHKFIDCKLEDSLERAALIYQAGNILIQLICMHKSESIRSLIDSEDNHEYSENCIYNLHEDQIAEMDVLIEKFLFCSPVICKEFKLEFANFYSTSREHNNFNSDFIEKLFATKKEIEIADTSSGNEIYIQGSNCEIELSMTYYDNYFKHLGALLTQFKYHLSNPQKILMCHMMAGEKFQVDQSQIGTVDFSLILKAISTLTHHLVANNNYYSALTLYYIFKNTSPVLWKMFPKEISNMFLHVLNDSHHYPTRFPVLAKLLINLHEQNQANPGWKKLAGMFTFVILEKIDKWISSGSDSKWDKINLLHLESAANFFISAFQMGITDCHPEQIKYYSKCLHRLVSTNGNGKNTKLIMPFINGIEKIDSENKDAIFIEIDQNFNKIFLFAPEDFFNNAYMYEILCDEMYFKNRIPQLERFLKKFIEQFEDQIENNESDSPHSYTRFLEIIFQGISIILQTPSINGKPSPSYFNVIDKLHPFVLKYTHEFLPEPESMEIFERNLNILSMLKRTNYFEIYDDDNYTFNCYKRDYVKAFKNICNEDTVTKILYNAMIKVFTYDEIEKMINSLSEGKVKKHSKSVFDF